MLYPELNEIPRSRIWTEEFYGLDRRPKAREGTFQAMGNMTGDRFPVLRSRDKRHIVRELDNPQGMMAMGKLAWIDGDTLYYDGEKTPIQSLSLDEDMLPKQMVSMGAYLLVFPDGMYYNTTDPLDYGTLVREYQSPEGEPVTFEMCDMAGEVYQRGKVTRGEEAPEEPEDGDYWLDTSTEPHALYVWHKQWIGISSVYVKIRARGIGRGLNEQDNVTLSGIQYEGNDEMTREQIALLNETHVLQAVGDDYLVVIGVIDTNCTQRLGPIRADRRAPRMDFVIECNNRLWGCRYGEQDGEFVNRIYSCALGDFRNWQKYQGNSMDSYYVNVGTDGPFTGAAMHRGMPYFFKETCFHQIYGVTPSDFQMVTTPCEGVKEGSGGTVVSHNGLIYYLGRNGPQALESLPGAIGKALGPGRLSGGAAGIWNEKYFLSVREENGSGSLYVLDTEKGTWCREDDGEALAFAALGGEMYMLHKNGLLYALNGTEGEEEEMPVSWYVETGPIGYEDPYRKYIGRLLLMLRLEKDAQCRILIDYDGKNEWQKKGRLNGSAGTVKTYCAPVIPRRCEYLRLRLEGEGAVELYGIAREVSRGSDGR